SSRPYRNNNAAYNNGLYIQGTGSYKEYRAKIWYFTPVRRLRNFVKGATLGTSQKLPYRRITQHLHIKLYNNGAVINPTPCLLRRC
ncbi:hypothetical protein, partial [Salmonella sp. s54412]|uniref:hypothetical protein n=1 Tax=Salmonella sp. s54412 TaxID=3160128 RepID=UPI003754A148